MNKTRSKKILTSNEQTINLKKSQNVKSFIVMLERWPSTSYDDDVRVSKMRMATEVDALQSNWCQRSFILLNPAFDLTRPKQHHSFL